MTNYVVFFYLYVALIDNFNGLFSLFGLRYILQVNN